MGYYNKHSVWEPVITPVGHLVQYTFRYISETGDFTWIDGTVLDYTNWRTNEPSSTSEECGEILTIGYTGGWKDAFCSDGSQYGVCKMPARKRCQLIFSQKFNYNVFK